MAIDPYTKEFYVGPRRTDAPSQATFVYGSGDELITFKPHLNAQKKKGKEKVGSKGANIDAAQKRIQQKFEGYNNKSSGSATSGSSTPAP
jgi:hypothetical protein